ncbi:MAG: hypothetical protein HUU60_01090 [Armatimonadetes bacterium]|nr:hypothetical protein [Armatimonadota bacterium]
MRQLLLSLLLLLGLAGLTACNDSQVSSEKGKELREAGQRDPNDPSGGR